jgi:hypothetical protein
MTPIPTSTPPPPPPLPPPLPPPPPPPPDNISSEVFNSSAVETIIATREVNISSNFNKDNQNKDNVILNQNKLLGYWKQQQQQMEQLIRQEWTSSVYDQVIDQVATITIYSVVDEL